VKRLIGIYAVLMGLVFGGLAMGAGLLAAGAPAPKAPATPTAKAAPAATSAAAPSSNELTLDLGAAGAMKLVLIRPGKFMMGETETHEVTLSKPFYMGTTTVTQAQYEAIMGNNPSLFKGPTNPVESVLWNEAEDFCKKLSAKTHQVVRLPTEAEWEYACRAGTKTAFSFGDDATALGDYAWYAGNSGGTTHPVGQKKPNAWGLYDMHGNVWEWCADWHADYPKQAVTDPQGPGSGPYRVVRGGSYRYGPVNCRSGNRAYYAPVDRDINCGFRVVASVLASGS
jgi:formylglycine-generating enzyme required for sulfatase activity